jgi:hypothetical protein
LKGSQIEIYQNGSNVFGRWISSMYADSAYGPAGTNNMLSENVVTKDPGGSCYYPLIIQFTLPEASVFSRKFTCPVKDGNGNIFAGTESRLLLKNVRIEDIAGIYVDQCTLR